MRQGFISCLSTYEPSARWCFVALYYAHTASYSHLTTLLQAKNRVLITDRGSAQPYQRNLLVFLVLDALFLPARLYMSERPLIYRSWSRFQQPPRIRGESGGGSVRVNIKYEIDDLVLP